MAFPTDNLREMTENERRRQIGLRKISDLPTTSSTSGITVLMNKNQFPRPFAGRTNKNFASILAAIRLACFENQDSHVPGT